MTSSELNTSIYLAQSYSDDWEDYCRSLKNPAFPVWDFIVLTASNEHQAAGFRAQIKARKDHLPARTKIGIIPDEGGVRVGSGGATLSVLKWLKENGGYEGKRVLVIHSGGDSKRVPQYSAVGKLFSPVPHVLPDGRSSTLFDEFMIAMSSVPGRIREGMLLLSGDVLLLFNPLLIDWSGAGAAVISFKEAVETGKNHGVYLRGEDGNVKSFLHKQSVETLRAVGAVNDAGSVDIDTGAILLGVDVLNALWGLISTNGEADARKYHAFVNDKVRLSLYGDFQYPMATDSALEQFYLEKPEGEYSDALRECRKAVWEALHGFRLKLLRLAPAKFIHFGTTREILALMNGGVDDYAALGWGKSVNSTGNGYNSVISPKATVGEGVYAEVSYVHSAAVVGDRVVLSYIDVHDETIPSGVVLHGLKQADGKFVVRIYGVDDNPKENRLFGREIPASLGSSLWNAPIYPEKGSIREALAAALCTYEKVTQEDWESLEAGKSMAAGFNDADPQAILDWNKRMEELVAMNRVQELIDHHVPATQAQLAGPLTKIQKEWLAGHLERADFGEKMRLYYYVGSALKDEEEVTKAFSSLSSAILEATLQSLEENRDARIRKEETLVKLPLRVNFGGGWSDTPPYCNENGGTVLNAAILLNGERPVSVRLKRIEERKVVFESRDMDVHGEFTDLEALQAVGDPFDPFVLQKAVLLACGVIPAKRISSMVNIEDSHQSKPSESEATGELSEESNNLRGKECKSKLSESEATGELSEESNNLTGKECLETATRKSGIPEMKEDLEAILDRLGGGIWMDTEVTGVPKGSGLGTSSILAAACVKALFEFLGIPHTEDDVYGHVLCMEQIMSTGGGWQDQVGGVTDGIKFITSKPGLNQVVKVDHVKLDDATLQELNERFTLIYTGQRRLARNLLRDVVGRYIGNEPDTVFALNEIQRKAALMRFELERGHVDDFAKLLTEHWELSKMIDAGSTNTLIDQIFDAVDDLLDGKMVCGAGGGGFLQVVLKKGVSKEQLQKRLKKVFADTEINVWNCELT